MEKNFDDIMNLKPRFFIQTKDDLFFAVNSYSHPPGYTAAFLRYVPSVCGERLYDDKKYTKVNSDEAYRYIRKHHPGYLINWNVKDKKMMCVKNSDIKKIYDPAVRLSDIIKSDDEDEFFGKIRKLAEIFHSAGISYRDMGITGSTLIGLQNGTTSDIDFIVYGLANHRKARELYGKLKYDENSPLEPIGEDFWNFVYDKRIKDDSVSLDEFKFYEERKNNRGVIDGSLFDILSTMKDEDIPGNNTDDLYYTPVGDMRINCTIIDDKQSFDTPGVYLVNNVRILEGPWADIDKVVSYTHTYAGSVQNNEEAIVSGVCEEVTDRKTGKKTYNLVVGTTRESKGEYIKLKKPVTIKK